MSSSIHPEFIQSIAESLGIETTKEAQRCLSLDLEYKIRDIIQYAHKVARKSRRSTINADDIDQAFRHLNVEPVYGISNTSDPFRFVKLAGHAQVMRVSDPMVPVDTLLETPLPSAPWEAGVRIHWLAIDGRQPSVPENVQMLKPLRKPKRRKTDILAPEPEEKEEQKNDGEGGSQGVQAPGGVLVKAPLKHVLSRELNLYLDRAIGVLEGSATHDGGEKKRLLDATLASLRLDAGIQPLAPYMCHTLAQNIWSELRAQEDDMNEEEDEGNEEGRTQVRRYDPVKLSAHLRASECIASNRTLDLSWYLHELIPAIVDVILDVPNGRSARIGEKRSKEDRLHELSRKYRWDQRESAAKAIASICVWYPEVAPRVQKQFVQALRANPETHIPAIYGAIVGIACQGERAVQTLLLPNLLPLVRNLTTHAKACSIRELDIVRDMLLSTAGSLLRKRIHAARMTPFLVEMKRLVSIPSPAVLFGSGDPEAGASHKDKQTQGARNQKATKATKTQKPRRSRKGSGGSLDDLFNDQEQDPCILFSESPQSVAASLQWMKKYCKANKAVMEPVSGNGEGRYHVATVYKNDRGENEVKHQTAASHKAGIDHLEVFPVSTVSYDTKMLQKAYAEDPRPEEYQRIVHNVFGIHSDPYCVHHDVFIL